MKAVRQSMRAEVDVYLSGVHTEEEHSHFTVLTGRHHFKDHSSR